MWLPSLLLIQLLMRYQSLLGQATVVHRTGRWSEGSCPHHLLQARSSRKSRATHGVCSCGLIVVKGNYTDEILRLSRTVPSQDVENRLIQSDFGTLKLRPVLTGLLSNGKLGRKLLRTLGTPLNRGKHVQSCQTQAQTLL